MSGGYLSGGICPKTMLEQDHKPNRNKCILLGFETNFYKRRFMESFFINNWPLTMNEKSSVDFLQIYCNFEKQKKNKKISNLALNIIPEESG